MEEEVVEVVEEDAEEEARKKCNDALAKGYTRVRAKARATTAAVTMSKPTKVMLAALGLTADLSAMHTCMCTSGEIQPTA
jgi:hypothetical protein